MKSHLTTAFLSLALFSTLTAADWPQWRGPDRDDISKETGLLKKWPDGGPKKLWMSDKGGLGYSGPAIAGGTLYTMGANDNGEEFLLALDAGTGTEKWRTPVGPRYPNKWGDGPRATPTVDGDLVYAMGGKGDLLCASTKDGKTVWKAAMADIGGKLPGWGYTESVCVDGANVYATPGGPQGAVVAFDKLTGKKLWQSTEWTDGAQYSSIVPTEINGTHQLVQRTSTNVAGIDPKEGKILWKQEFPKGKVAVIPTPIIKGNQVYVSAGYGAGCMAFTVGADNKTAVTYENGDMENHHGGVILIGDHLFGHSNKGGWTCQDWKTGAVKWVEKSKLGKGAIHCADGMLYLVDESNGTVALIEASTEGWKEQGRFKLDPQTQQRAKDGRIWTHPVVSNGKLYLRDQELIFCYDVKG
jgi:outer membrane protein assembly factor BamB